MTGRARPIFFDAEMGADSSHLTMSRPSRTRWTELARNLDLLRLMGEANREHVLEELTVAHMVDQFEQAYTRSPSR